MKRRIKELLKLFILGDTKRPPQFCGMEFSSPTLSDFKYIGRRDERGKAYIFMGITLGTTRVEVSWSAQMLKWQALIVSKNLGSLSYKTTYYHAHSELKRIIDFMCDAANREYKMAVKREKISIATREVNLFRDVLQQMEDLENTRSQKDWEAKNRNMIETVSDVL